MASPGFVPLTTARGPLLIRAPLSSHDDTDSELSPLSSHSSNDSFESAASDSDDATSARLPPAVPLAPITGDEEEGIELEEELEMEAEEGDDGLFPVARVVSSEKDLILREGETGSVMESFTDISTTNGNQDDSEGNANSNLIIGEENTAQHEMDDKVDSFSRNGSEIESFVGPVTVNGNQEDLDGNLMISEESSAQLVYNGNQEDSNGQASNGSNQDMNGFVANKFKFEPEDSLNCGDYTFNNVITENGLHDNVSSLVSNAGDANQKDLVEELEDLGLHEPSITNPNLGSTQTELNGKTKTDVSAEPSIANLKLDSPSSGVYHPSADVAELSNAALTKLVRSVTGAGPDDSVTISYTQEGARVFSVNRAPQTTPQAEPTRNYHSTPVEPPLPSGILINTDGMSAEEREMHDKTKSIRVKFLRLALRLGFSLEDRSVSEVLYRLTLAEGLRFGWSQSNQVHAIENTVKKVLELESEGTEDLNFSFNMLLLGKTGVGKSSIINSVFNQEKSRTDAFSAATHHIWNIVGDVNGVNLRVIDTPGLGISPMDQASNRKILYSIKKHIKKYPPDVVLYVDRIDNYKNNFTNLPLLRLITAVLGESIWLNSIIALTHAGSAPPEGPTGDQLGYDLFISRQSNDIMQVIQMAARGVGASNPVVLVENHPNCRKNRDGESVLPNGLVWRSHLLLLCYSIKILAEARLVLNAPNPNFNLSGSRPRPVSLPYLLSCLLQSKSHPKLPNNPRVLRDDDVSDNEFEDLFELEKEKDQEKEEDDEYEYDSLPPFNPLKKSQIEKLTKEQKRAYFDEYDYRAKLLQRKTLKEEIKRLREESDNSKNTNSNKSESETSNSVAIPVALPDMALPLSFDCDCPTYRYRSLQPGSGSQTLTRPILNPESWDHDCGFNGVSFENSLAVSGRFPAHMSVQLTKDKREFRVHLDSCLCAIHGERGSTLTSLDLQRVGNSFMYILRGETKFKNLNRNRTTGGILVNFLGDSVAFGGKVEDRVRIGKRVVLNLSTGAVRAPGDVIWGANLETRIRDRDYPISKSMSTVGLSLMRSRGDLVIGADLRSEVSVGGCTNLGVHWGINNKKSGQLGLRVSTSEQLEIAVLGLISIGMAIFKGLRRNASFEQ